MTTAVLGQAAVLVGGSIILTMDPLTQKYWFIQCQSLTAFLNISIPGFVGKFILNPVISTYTGAGAGEFLDSNKFPFFPTQFTLTSTDLTAPFCAWSSIHPPIYPMSQWPSNK